MGIWSIIKDIFVFICRGLKFLLRKAQESSQKREEQFIQTNNIQALKKEYETKVINSNDIEEINSVYESFKNNKDLIKICKNSINYVHSSIWSLEFAFVPYIYSSYFKQPFRLNTKSSYDKDSDFIQQSLLYSQNLIENNLTYAKYAYTILLNQNYYNASSGPTNYGIRKPDGISVIDDPYATNREICKCFDDIDIYEYNYISIHEEFIELNNLFESLIHQNIINCNINLYSYCAFLYMLYSYKKQSFYKDAKKTIEGLGLDINSDEKTIIKTMFDNDLEEAEIITAICGIRSKNNKYIDLLCQSYADTEILVKAVLKDLKEKQKVKSLLNENKNYSNRITITDIDLMSGAEFEKYITYLFNNLGYKASNTKLSGDQGIDVIAKKGVTKIAIQCKCFSKPVGNHAVMEAVAGGKYYNVDKVMVITNNTFTKSARELAKANNVVLWDRKILIEKLKEV